MASPRHLNMTYQEPQAISEGASKDIEFLLDTGATYSVLTQSNGLLSQHSCTVIGIDGWPQVKTIYLFTSLWHWLSLAFT